MSTTRPSDDDFVVHVPPPGDAVALRRIDDAVDLVFLLQPVEDALVALCDEHRHVLLVVETSPSHLLDVADLAGRVDAVCAAVVFTCGPVDDAPPEDAIVAWHRLSAAYERHGLDLLDWLQVDDVRVRSLAETAGLGSPWP